MHVVYELIMINSLPVTVTVDRIEVLDAGRRGKVLADLRGAALNGVMSSLPGSADGRSGLPRRTGRCSMCGCRPARTRAPWYTG